MGSTGPTISTTADSYETPEVGEWAEEKGGLLAHYCQQFATAMKNRWDERVYIDLFAGAGKVRVRGSNKVLLGSPLLALAVRDPFDKYIFCEKDPGPLQALRNRVSDMHPGAQVTYIPGDVNRHVEQILQAMPPFSKTQKVLGFCLADPYGLKDLKFSTIATLATRFMDFLVNIPAMAPQRAWKPYLNKSNHTVDDFLGTADWRTEWQRMSPRPSLPVFVAQMFDRCMRNLEFAHGGFLETVPVRSTEKRVLLYRLGFFSRNPLGGRFWLQAKKGVSQQRNLF